MTAASKHFQKYQAERDEVMSKIACTNDLKQAVISLERDLLHERYGLLESRASIPSSLAMRP